MPNKIAFVTGGTGFVGSHLVELLLAEGYSVRCLVRKDLKWLKGLDVEVFQGDLHDRVVLESACSNATFVFHVAAVTRAKNWEIFERENIQGTKNLLQAILAAKSPNFQRAVITSSQAASGPSSYPKTENEPLQPISAYGKSKQLMEKMVQNSYNKLPITVVRPPSVYGPRETDIFTFIQTINRRICPIVGNGDDKKINIVFVRDLVEGMLQAALSEHSNHETYFLGHKDTTWHEIRDAIAKALNKKPITLHLPQSFIEPLGAMVEEIGNIFGNYPPLNREKAKEAKHSWCLSIEKAKKAFNYAPKTSITDGMQKTIAWYKKEGWI